MGIASQMIYGKKKKKANENSSGRDSKRGGNKLNRTNEKESPVDWSGRPGSQKRESKTVGRYQGKGIQ